MKVIEIKNKQYNVKQVFAFFVSAEKAVYRRKKEFFGFEKGIVCIRKEDGSNHYFQTNSNSEGECMFYVYRAEPGKMDIIFRENVLNEEWTRVFAFFCDEDGAALVYADREILKTVGAKFVTCGEEWTKKLESEAAIVAKLWGNNLYDQFANVIFQEEVEDDRKFECEYYDNWED